MLTLKTVCQQWNRSEKRQRGGYMTTKPLPEPKEVIPKVVDMKRYQHDKKLYGESITEVNRKNGLYMFIKNP